MREFIYRVWSIEEKKYVMTGSLYGCEGIAGLSQYFNRKTHVIEEYTGCKDKNGTRIFEGDIVKHTIKGVTPDIVSVVKWQAYSWYYYHQDGGSTPLVYRANGEVLGNIFENKNLFS